MIGLSLWGQPLTLCAWPHGGEWAKNVSQSVWAYHCGKRPPQRDTLYMGIQQSQDKCPGIRPQDGVSWDPGSQS